MAAGAVLARDRSLAAVWSKTLRDQRRALTWWSIGIVLLVLMYAAFFPSIKNNAAQFDQYMKNLPKTVRDMLGGADIASPEGYLMSEIFSFMGPVLLLVYAIGAGARAIAGEEEAGTLDLLLSTPVRRRRIVLDKFVAMTLGTLLLGGLAWAAAAVAGPPFDLTVSFAGLAAAFLNLFLMALAFGAIALAVGAATGGRALAIGASSGAALATFLLKTFAATLTWLQPYRLLSPFYYYTGHDPLRTGFHVADPIVLAAVALAALAVALVAFEGRDLAA
jgi:ABC-2 type transport system permease protein